MTHPSQAPKPPRAQQSAKLEEMFLSGEVDPELGIYRRVFSAKCSSEGQDGGVVTALLTNGLEKGLFDAAVVVGRGQGYRSQVIIAHRASEVAAARGTKYLRTQVTPKLREAIEEGTRRLAVVCSPCEVAAARRIQQESGCDILVIGLFCYEAFDAKRLKQQVEAHLGVDLDAAERTQVRQGRFSVQVGGSEFTCRVRDLEEAAEKACRYCEDFSSRLADVSVGSVGSRSGYSTVIVRSEAGEKLVETLDCAKEAVNREEIVKLSVLKRKRAKANRNAAK